MTYLADVNVWLALAYGSHVHHPAAMEWFTEPADDLIAFCRITQNGLLRLLTNRHVMGGDILTASRAWDIHDSFYADHRIRFAQEPPGLEHSWRDATRHAPSGPNFWTDAYLAAFAAAAGYTIVTFDRGFRRHRGVPLRLLAAT